MKTAGIDIASAGKAALSLATDGKPKRAFIWQPEHHRDSEAVKLVDFYDWLAGKFDVYRPQIVAVEQVAGFMNRKVIQALSRFEGVALLAAKQSGAIVVNPTVGSSRNIVYGVPSSCSKEDAYAAFKKLFPNFPTGKVNQGGMDKADAMTHALAAEIHLERGARTMRRR
jgi:Holliday junction resolvasome RuvABC endonuclease subunit